MADSCQRIKEPLGAIKDGKCFNHLSDYQNVIQEFTLTIVMLKKCGG